MDAVPQRHLITSRAELAEGLVALVSLARSSMRVCAYDASVMSLDSAAMADLLRALLLSHRRASVRVLVDTTQWIETRAPRFKTLQRRYGHALQVREASPQDAVSGDMHVVVDDLHSLELKAARLTAGEIWTFSPQRAQPLAATFDRRWAAAAHDVPLVPLGL